MKILFQQNRKNHTKLSGINMAFPIFGALKLGLNAASHIYKKRQETKMAMADAQHMHASKMARGEEAYQGKLLEARQNDYKDEVVLAILTLPILVLAYGGSGRTIRRRWRK
jgi:hypothetical protein